MSEIPLVSIIIPTYNRTAMLMGRSLPSALNQTYPNIEILVVGDGTEQETVDFMAKVKDPRVSFTNLPRPNYPTIKDAIWQVGGTYPINWGLDNAKGEWVTFLGDDDELRPEFVTTLLTLALAHDFDFVYGVAELRVIQDETMYWSYVGEYPPRMSGLVGSGLWKASMGYRYDTESWKKNLPCDWELYSRMLENNVRFGFTERIVYNYYPAPEGLMYPQVIIDDEVREFQWSR